MMLNTYEPLTRIYPVETPLRGWGRSLVHVDPVHRRMVLILASVALIFVPMFVLLRPDAAAQSSLGERAQGADDRRVAGSSIAADTAAASGLRESDGSGMLSSVFTPEVLAWEPQILAWAAAYGLDPNHIGIIMQIESCGHPEALSVAGAQGLFQVMPFHFQEGEDSLDPETNARRGLLYFKERLSQSDGDVGRAFAGYNGGHVAAAGTWDEWVPETQRYYYWSTGILRDIRAGIAESPTVREWLEAGGASLCRQAAATLQLD